jgi:hypothetical protein
MNKKNIFLLLMLLTYFFIIFIVCTNYNSHKSISKIICDNEIKYIIFLLFIFFGLFTILYELERNNLYSFSCIIILLLSLYGLILYNTEYIIHYIFALIVSLCILFFMTMYCENKILKCSLFIQFFILGTIVFNIQKNIFYNEAFYILNFAFYYLYLHFIY